MTSILTKGQHSDKLFWFSLGVFLVAASHITYRQLETFKKRCEIKPARQKDTVDKSTENAIRLDTLAVLARGINYNLSRAALRIIAGRALSPDTFPKLLENLTASRVSTRLQAIKTFRFLIHSKPKSDKFYENDSDYVLSQENEHKLCTVEACKAILTAINKSIVRNGQNHDTLMDDCKRYGIDCLLEITIRNVNVAIEAGVKKFLQDYPIEGYANIEAAIQDKEYQPENYQLIEIFSDVSRMEETLSQARKAQARRDQANASNSGRTFAEVLNDGISNDINNNDDGNNNDAIPELNGNVVFDSVVLLDNTSNNNNNTNTNGGITDHIPNGLLDFSSFLDNNRELNEPFVFDPNLFIDDGSNT